MNGVDISICEGATNFFVRLRYIYTFIITCSLIISLCCRDKGFLRLSSVNVKW